MFTLVSNVTPWPALCLVALVAALSAASVQSAPPRGYLVSALTLAPKTRVVVEIVSATGRVLRVVDHSQTDGVARWSPDGRMIAWTNLAGLYVENEDGSDRRLLVAAARRRSCVSRCVAMTFAWSHDSKSIAVGGVGEYTNHLVAADVASGATTELEPVYRYTEYEVISFSPNGSELAFARESGDEGTASCCKGWLVVAHANGSDERRLFSFADPIHDGPGDSSWSPNSESIAFVDDGMDARDPRLAVVGVSTGRVRSIPGLNNADSPPVWSPDGHSFTVVRVNTGRPTTYSVNIFNLTTGRATSVGSGAVPIAWYPDGSITTLDGTRSVSAINSTTGDERTLFRLPRGYEIVSVDPAPGQ
jgi:Tol biopolymer transport system component